MIGLWFAIAGAAEYRISSSEEVETTVAVLQPGDTLLIAAGEMVVAEGIALSLSGTASAPITIRGEDGAELVVGSAASSGLSLTGSMWLNVENLTIRGDADWAASSFSGVRLSNVEDVRLSNVHIHSVGGSGVVITDGSERVTVQDSEISDTATGNGVSVGCSDETDTECYVLDSSLTHNWIHNISGGSAVVLNHGTQGVNIVDSVMYDIEGNGIYLGSTESGLQNGADSNAIWNTGSAGISIRGAAMVRNNIVFNTSSHGISSVNPERSSYDTMIISFNTVVNTQGWGMILNDWDQVTNSVLANNAVYNPAGRAIRMTYDETADHPGTVNLITTNMVNGWVDGLEYISGQYDLGYGWSDFLDVEGWNFYPAPGSALLNAANPSGDTYIPNLDFNGVSRNGSSPEIGAYEYDGDTNPGWAIQEGAKSFALNYPQENEVIGGCGNQKAGAALLLLPFLLLRRRRD